MTASWGDGAGGIQKGLAYALGKVLFLLSSSSLSLSVAGLGMK